MTSSFTHMGYSEEDIQTIFDKAPYRRTQISTLLSLFGSKGDLSCGSIFVYGHTATGKSFVVKTLMKTLKLPHVLVNCIENFNSKLIYEHILNNLQDDEEENPFTTCCNNMVDFLRLLKQSISHQGLQDETFYIILDKAERLREMETNILPAFLRLQELTDLNVCSILLSEIIWEKFFSGTGFKDPSLIHFKDYSKDHLKHIMCLDCPSDYPVELFSAFCQLLLSVFYTVCRDLIELRHLALLHFPKYCEPITKGQATYTDTHKLWRNIGPHLKRALNTVYLREVSSKQWENILTQDSNENLDHLNGPAPIVGNPQRSHIELPFYSKYLLLAAYMASYNPARTDKRFFSKQAQKMSNRGKAAAKAKKGKITSQLTGPKSFPLDRLMAIFYTIVEEKVAPSASILSQISSLVSLNLLSQVSADDQIDSTKYKCLVNYDFIKGIARQLDFDIVQYLFDFV